MLTCIKLFTVHKLDKNKQKLKKQKTRLKRNSCVELEKHIGHLEQIKANFSRTNLESYMYCDINAFLSYLFSSRVFRLTFLVIMK